MSQPDTPEETHGRKEPSSNRGPTTAQRESAGSEIADLEIAWKSGNRYHVWSERELQQSYLVDLSGEIPTCNCEHGIHNRDSKEACRHIKKAITVLPSNPELDKSILTDLINVLTDVYSLRDEQRRLVTGLEADGAANVNAPSSGGSSTGADATEAARRLQSAYDERADGLNVEVHGNDVWVNKSPEAPDWTFDAWLNAKNTEYMEYAPDDSPKQYFNNRISPSDVDSYIEEVLS